MATTLIYTRPSDEVGASATVTLATGTADANYPVTKVQTTDPDDAFLTSSTGGVDIVWDHGTATDVQVFSLHAHNIPAGTDVRIQRNAANSWAGPTVDAAVTIDTYPADGLPTPVGVDLTGATGYDAGGFRYTRLHIPSVAQKVGIGSALLWSTKRTDLRNLRYPATPYESHPVRAFSTLYGHRRVYELGVRLRRISSATIVVGTTEAAAMLELFRAARQSGRPFLWWMDTTGRDAWLAEFSEDTTIPEWSTPHVQQGQVIILERACGLALPTA